MPIEKRETLLTDYRYTCRTPGCTSMWHSSYSSYDDLCSKHEGPLQCDSYGCDVKLPPSQFLESSSSDLFCPKCAANTILEGEDTVENYKAGNLDAALGLLYAAIQAQLDGYKLELTVQA